MGYRERRGIEGSCWSAGGGGVWEGEAAGVRWWGVGGLDEKKHWCVDRAALLFSLMFPLLSAV